MGLRHIIPPRDDALRECFSTTPGIGLTFRAATCTADALKPQAYPFDNSVSLETLPYAGVTSWTFMPRS